MYGPAIYFFLLEIALDAVSQGLQPETGPELAASKANLQKYISHARKICSFLIYLCHDSFENQASNYNKE